jgi:hypothetical protein
MGLLHASWAIVCNRQKTRDGKLVTKKRERDDSLYPGTDGEARGRQMRLISCSVVCRSLCTHILTGMPPKQHECTREGAGRKPKHHCRVRKNLTRSFAKAQQQQKQVVATMIQFPCAFLAMSQWSCIHTLKNPKLHGDVVCQLACRSWWRS